MRVRFSGIDLDAARREVWRGDQRLTIEPRVLDLLVYLIRHRERMVPKDELLDALWPEQEVLEGALSVCVHRARKLVEEGGPPAIRTFARRGYGFIAPVEVLGEEDGAGADERMVGRAAEIGTIRQAVDALLARQMRTVEVIGEAGIGKTTLLDDIGRYARRVGVEVLRASASLHTDSNAFSLWAQVIGAYALQREGAVARRVLGAHAETLGRVVPLLRGWMTPSQTSDSLRQTRVRLFDAVAQVIDNAAAEKPLVLLLDDLHWVDSDSLVMLRFVLATCSQSPLLVAVAYRGEASPSEALSSLSQEMSKRPGHCRVELSGLAEHDVHERLEQLAGGELPVAASTAAATATRGNPLWIEEWWRTALRSGCISKERAGWVTHRSVDEVRVRFGPEAPALQAASSSCRQVLQVISLLESQATPDLVRRVSSFSDVDLTAAVREAERLEILVAAAEAGEPLRFSHPAIQEEFYRQMNETDRARLHRSAGVELERFYDGTLDEHAGLLARHFLAGIDASSAELAIRYAEEAGHQAFAALAFDRAAMFFDDALEACERFRPDDSVRMWPSYMMLAESYLQAGEEERARRAYRDRVLMLSGDRMRRLPVADGGQAPPPVGVTRLMANIQAALRLPGATARDDRGNLQRASQAALAAVRNAQERADAGPLTHALIGRRWLEFVSELEPGHHLSQSTEALRLAETLGSPDLVQEARLLSIHDLLVAGRMEEVDRGIAAYAKIALATREPAYHWVHLYLSAMRAHLAGRLGEAERLAEQALALGTMHFGEVAGVIYWAQVSSIRSQQGRFAEVLPWLEALIHQFPHVAVVQSMLCRAYCDLGRFEDAQRLLPSAINAIFEPDSTQRSSWLRAALTLARVLTQLNDREHATALLEKLDAYADLFVVLPVAVACGGPVSAILAPLAATAGLESRARELFDRALDTLRAIDAAVLLEDVQQRYARFQTRGS